jgi:TolB-like protein/cytochrome c-type biogenesis protein CcmH/NrfG
VPRRGYRLLQQPRFVDEPDPVNETGVFQIPDDGSFISKLMRRGVVQAAAAYMLFSWALIQVADIFTPTLNLPVWVPTLVTIAAIGGFPIVLVLAWMLERSEGRWFLDRGRQSGKMLSGLERNYLSILVAYGVAAVGALTYQLTVGFDVSGGPEATVAEADELLPVNPNSIAVLKFLNIGNNETGEFFSQGLGEDILDRLARIPGLAVSSRGDSWSLPENASSEIVRRRLRVAYFLEGSVRVVGDELRVVVQLIESATGFHVFSRSFETELTDHMNVQREITDLAVASLRVALPEDADTGMHLDDTNIDIDAYLLFKRGKAALYDAPNGESIDEAISQYSAALEIDPQFAAAHSGICEASLAQYELTYDEDALQTAELACSSAFNMSPNLDVVSNAIGRLRLATGDKAEAEVAFRRALGSNPNSVDAMLGLASILEMEQRLEDAERVLQKAIDLQPGNWRSMDWLGSLYFTAGRFGEAADAYRKVVLLDPANWIGHGNLGNALMMSGDFDAALASLDESLAIQRDAFFLSSLGTIHYYLGEYDRAAEIQEEATEMLPNASFAWLNLGDALRFSSHPEDAEAAYMRAISTSIEQLDRNPISPVDLYVQAWARASTGDEADSKELIARALELAPADPYPHYYDGLIKMHSGDLGAAIGALGRAVGHGYPVAMLSTDPLFHSIRDDRRFEDLLDKGLLQQ